MEKNTFATSAYIAAPHQRIIDYLADLRNLDEWTLFSRMQRQVGESTWIGTASSYQQPLYYHVKRADYGSFHGIEWHCGFEQGVYHQVYPVLVFPPGYIDPAEHEPGAYLHWVSFVDPARRTPMIAEGMPGVRPFPDDAPPGHGDRIHPGRVMDAVQAVFVDSGQLVMAETGNSLAWAINRLRFTDPTHWRGPSGLVGSMGHFSTGVVGAALATARTAVALTGDGSMLMLNEVSTAVATGAPAIWVVFNDSCYNMCAQGAQVLGLTNVDCSLPETDFAAYARSLGATGAPTAGRNAGLLRDGAAGGTR